MDRRSQTRIKQISPGDRERQTLNHFSLRASFVKLDGRPALVWLRRRGIKLGLMAIIASMIVFMSSAVATKFARNKGPHDRNVHHLEQASKPGKRRAL